MPKSSKHNKPSKGERLKWSDLSQVQPKAVGSLLEGHALKLVNRTKIASVKPNEARSNVKLLVP